MYHSISTTISCTGGRRDLRIVLWKQANALAVANECLKSLGLKYLVQTHNVFAVEVLRIPSPSQSSAHCCDCCDKSVRAKVRNDVHIPGVPEKTQPDLNNSNESCFILVSKKYFYLHLQILE